MNYGMCEACVREQLVKLRSMNRKQIQKKKAKDRSISAGSFL